MTTVSTTEFESKFFPCFTDPETIYDLLSDLLPGYEQDRVMWAHNPGIVASIEAKIATIRSEMDACGQAMLAEDEEFDAWSGALDARAIEMQEEELWAAARDARRFTVSRKAA